MQINQNTKISEIIKHNMEAIAVIASINPHFKKLKNPILRSLLAPRVSLLEASKIGKCELSVLFDKLKEIGFTVENESVPEIINLSNQQIDISKLTIIETIDVRPIIASFDDPFLLLLNASKKLKLGETLEVINSFEPIPLVRILSKKGFHCTTILKEDLYVTYIEKKEQTEEKIVHKELIHELSKEDFLALELTLTKELIEIDVRDLEMPLPMLTILETLEQLTKDQVLKVHHKKVPQFLFLELIQRNFTANYHVVSDQEVTLLISS